MKTTIFFNTIQNAYEKSYSSFFNIYWCWKTKRSQICAFFILTHIIACTQKKGWKTCEKRKKMYGQWISKSEAPQCFFIPQESRIIIQKCIQFFLLKHAPQQQKLPCTTHSTARQMRIPSSYLSNKKRSLKCQHYCNQRRKCMGLFVVSSTRHWYSRDAFFQSHFRTHISIFVPLTEQELK